MFIVMLYVKGIAQPFGLRFKEEAKGREVWKQVAELPAAPRGMVPNGAKENIVDLMDDYGQSLSVARGLVEAVHFMPVEQDMEAQADMRLMGERATAKLQSRANADPVLGLHQMGAGSRLIRPQ